MGSVVSSTGVDVDAPHSRSESLADEQSTKERWGYEVGDAVNPSSDDFHQERHERPIVQEQPAEENTIIDDPERYSNIQRDPIIAKELTSSPHHSENYYLSEEAAEIQPSLEEQDNNMEPANPEHMDVVDPWDWQPRNQQHSPWFHGSYSPEPEAEPKHRPVITTTSTTPPTTTPVSHIPRKLQGTNQKPRRC